jgi:hypothetical protein
VVLLKTMVHINWGAQCGEDEKGTVRYDYFVLSLLPQYNMAKRRDTAGSELIRHNANNWGPI